MRPPGRAAWPRGPPCSPPPPPSSRSRIPATPRGGWHCPWGSGPGDDMATEGLAMSETVLVVDDDPDVARFVEVNLRSAGYEVSVASNGAEGLARAVALRPDLVLLDVMMPKLDGFEVAQRLRRDPRTSPSSIILLTAKARP